jgi:hypothetical protein
MLPMVSQNPTGDRPSVAIDLPDSQLAKLREIFSFCLGGVEEDLKAPGRLSELEKARRDADAYQHLLAALDGGRLVPEPDVARAVREVAASVDLNNEYERVLAEHDALHGLLAQIEGCPRG